jgi:Sugar (and other) transporter.
MPLGVTDIGRDVRSGNDSQDHTIEHSGHGLVADQEHDNGSVVAQYSSLNVEHSEPQLIIKSEEAEETSFTLQTLSKYYRQVIISLFLSVMQNFCGHPNVLNFAPEIFAQIGFASETDQLISTTFVGVVSVVVVVVVDKLMHVAS